MRKSQLRELAGASWRLGKRNFTFLPADLAGDVVGRSRPWIKGKDVYRLPLLDERGRLAYLVSIPRKFVSLFRQRAQQLTAARLYCVPQLRCAPRVLVDTRDVGRPVGVSFDFVATLWRAPRGHSWAYWLKQFEKKGKIWPLHVRLRLIRQLVQATAALETAGVEHDALDAKHVFVRLRRRKSPELAITGFDRLPPAAYAEAILDRPPLAEGHSVDRFRRDRLLAQFLLPEVQFPEEDRPLRTELVAPLQKALSTAIGALPSSWHRCFAYLADPSVVLSSGVARPSSVALCEQMGWAYVQLPGSVQSPSISVPGTATVDFNAASGPAPWAGPSARRFLRRRGWRNHRLEAAVAWIVAVALGFVAGTLFARYILEHRRPPAQQNQRRLGRQIEVRSLRLLRDRYLRNKYDTLLDEVFGKDGRP